MVERIAAAATIAHADIEIAVNRTEEELAAVVIGIGLVDGQDHLCAARIGQVGVCGGDAIAGNDRGAISSPGIIDVEVAIRTVVGVEGDTQ